MSSDRIEYVIVQRLRLTRFELSFHANLGSKGHLWAFRCPDFPRLTISRHSQRGKIVSQTFRVDGIECADLVACADALNAPPREAAAQPSTEQSLFEMAEATREKTW